MAPKTSPNLFIFSVLVSITIFTTLPRSSHGKLEPPTNNNNYNNKIRGMFVFGSSLVDNGNNNFLQNSLAKADYYPYGIDFPFGPTGRFTNGKNVIDLLCELLKLPSYIPPFADPSTKGSKILHGVNFASGGSGILDNTGALAVRNYLHYSSLNYLVPFISFLFLFFFLILLSNSESISFTSIFNDLK